MRPEARRILVEPGDVHVGIGARPGQIQHGGAGESVHRMFLEVIPDAGGKGAIGGDAGSVKVAVANHRDPEAVLEGSQVTRCRGRQFRSLFRIVRQAGFAGKEQRPGIEAEHRLAGGKENHRAQQQPANDGRLRARTCFSGGVDLGLDAGRKKICRGGAQNWK